ncbi:MAG: phytanoyl-CoA dioxygenase family protein [Armatimonadetes bacterium]|nr:phytanoyl-CoA dioxygenase family protein [Armatimonadota bacterium]
MEMEEDLREQGWSMLPNVLSAAEVEHWQAELEQLRTARNALAHRESGYGLRGILRACPEIARVVGSEAFLGRIGLQASAAWQPVRGILFDKLPGANWKVPWHQDRTLAVAERQELPALRGWSRKEGVWHVQAPVSVLERMVTLRLHLDPCGRDDGPLQVLSRSHRNGILSPLAIQECLAAGSPAVLTAPAGSGLLLRPLLLHASTCAAAPRRRRILHVEYSADPAPAGLTWACF